MLPGFKHPAREMPTPPSEYIPLRAGVVPPPTRLFFTAGWQFGMKGKFSNRT